MVKVIFDKPVICRKTICSECGFELEYNKIDIKTGTSSYMGASNIYNYIECPQCKNNTYVKPWY